MNPIYLVALIALIAGYLVGAYRGNNKIERKLNDELRSHENSVYQILKYYKNSLPFWEREANEDYNEFRKHHEEEPRTMMQAVAYHRTRIDDFLLSDLLKEPSKKRFAEEFDKAFENQWKDVVTETESFNERMRKKHDSEFGKSAWPLNDKSLSHWLEAERYSERYIRQTPYYETENRER